MAEHHLDDDPTRARELIVSARQKVQGSIGELRQTRARSAPGDPRGPRHRRRALGDRRQLADSDLGPRRPRSRPLDRRRRDRLLRRQRSGRQRHEARQGAGRIGARHEGRQRRARDRSTTTATVASIPSKGTGIAGIRARVNAVDGIVHRDARRPADPTTRGRADPRGGGRRDERHDERPTSPLIRTVVADDSVLLRDGVVRLLTDSGFDVVAAVGDADALLDAVAEHDPRPVHRRRAHAADAHRRGSAGGDRDQAPSPRCRRAGAVAVRRGALRRRTAGRQRVRSRLPPEGPRDRRRRLPRLAAACRRRRQRRRHRGRSARSSAARASGPRSTGSRPASERCSR